MMLRGLSAFPITPASPEGRIDTDGLRRVLAPLLAAGVDSIGLLGSTGSYPYFSRAERRRAVDEAVPVVGGQLPLLVGVGAMTTAEAVALAEDARAAGADAGLLAPVSYQPLLDEEVFAHFAAVAATGLPLVIYNNPATTRFNFSTALIGRLAGIPGVVAVKNPGMPAAEAKAAVAELRGAVPDGFSVGFSGDWTAPGAVLEGGDAWYSVVGGTFPRATLALCRAAQAGDRAAFAERNAALEPLWALFRTYGSYRIVHHAAARAGIGGAAPPRPVLPLPEAALREVGTVLDRLDLA